MEISTGGYTGRTSMFFFFVCFNLVEFSCTGSVIKFCYLRKLKKAGLQRCVIRRYLICVYTGCPSLNFVQISCTGPVFKLFYLEK